METKESKGITLIALVLTIITLIILFGISINMLTGQNSILKRVQEAKEKTEEAQKEEISNLDKLEKTINDNLADEKVEQVDDENPGILEQDTNDENTYIISSIEDLVAFSYSVNKGNTYEGKTVKIGISLDFASKRSYVDAFRTDYDKYGYSGELRRALTSNCGWNSIGDEINIDINNFKGIFDGNGKIIYNLYINRENIRETRYIGFFANNGGTIKNLNLKDVNINISGVDEIYYFIGGIAGNNKGIIVNCEIDGICKSKGSYALIAGISGRNQGTMELCINKAKITGEAMYIAGIVAQNLSKVQKCGNEGEIYSIKSGYYVGGITGLGNLDDSCIEESFNSGNIFVKNKRSGYIGGIVGQAYSNIKNCYNTGNIFVSLEKTNNVCDVGGITGFLGYRVTNCYNKGTMNVKNISGELYMGGIIGSVNVGFTRNIYSETLFETNGYINNGALIGIVRNNNVDASNIVNLYFYGEIEEGIGKSLLEENIDYIKLGERPNQSKILEIINADGENKFIEDTKDINSGYPILYWQK